MRPSNSGHTTAYMTVDLMNRNNLRADAVKCIIIMIAIGRKVSVTVRCPSICLSQHEPTAANPLLQVCCCVPGGQEISTYCCTAGARQQRRVAGECGLNTQEAEYRLITPPPIGERSIVMTVSVCACVRVCPRAYLWKYTADLYQIFVHVSVTYGRGSFLLWRRCDTLYTSGFMDDVILAHKLRQLNMAAQLIEAQSTCSLRLGYKRRV